MPSSVSESRHVTTLNIHTPALNIYTTALNIHTKDLDINANGLAQAPVPSIKGFAVLSRFLVLASIHGCLAVVDAGIARTTKNQALGYDADSRVSLGGKVFSPGQPAHVPCERRWRERHPSPAGAYWTAPPGAPPPAVRDKCQSEPARERHVAVAVPPIRNTPKNPRVPEPRKPHRTRKPKTRIRDAPMNPN
eukprot:139856-Prorocentrum_minimum.AAC.7